MDKQRLDRFIACAKYFDVKIGTKYIWVNDSHTSVIMNPDTKWKDFLGYSILQIAELLSNELNKKIRWM